MRATLDDGAKRLAKTEVIWRSGSNGPGGQFGANILFSPDGQYLFLSSGERQRFTPAQDPKQALGKILRLTLDGKAAPGNPMFAKGGVEAMTWSSGHRNPYGMAFAPDGRLWEEEMGPRGGDELNLIAAGQELRLADRVQRRQLFGPADPRSPQPARIRRARSCGGTRRSRPAG